MKFLSVCVLYVHIRVAYSYYIEPTSVPSNPNDSPNEYATWDVQNTPQPYRLGYVPNAYPGAQDYTSNQPSDYQIGPGLPIPSQIPQSNSGIQQTVPMNSPTYNAELPSYVSPVHPIVSHPFLKAMYRKSIPNKRYTVIHPNGTIEHMDDIHGVTAKYSKYIMVKAADILAHANNPNSYEAPTTPEQNTLPDRISQPITTSNQNVDLLLTNTYRKRDAWFNPSTGLDEVPKNISSTETVQTEEVKNVSTIEDSHETVVAGNPLPNYPTNPNSTTTNDKVPLDSSVKNDVDKANITDVNNTTKNKTSSNNQPTSTNPTVTVQIPPEMDHHENLPVILPEVNPQSILPAIQTANTNEGSHENENIPSVTTIEEPLPLNNQKESNTATSSSTEQIINLSLSTDKPKQNVQAIDLSNTTIASVSNQTSATPGNRAPLSWFRLSDESVWEAIRNNTSNVYFLFLPPRPKVSKETRTTIFPNGTSVEEIIETVVDIGQDGQPKATKHSTVVQN